MVPPLPAGERFLFPCSLRTREEVPNGVHNNTWKVITADVTNDSFSPIIIAPPDISPDYLKIIRRLLRVPGLCGWNSSTASKMEMEFSIVLVRQ